MPPTSTTATTKEEDGHATNQLKLDITPLDAPTLAMWGFLCAGSVWAISTMELVVFTFTRERVELDIGMGTVALELLSAAVPLGFVIGGPVFGFIGDRHGRRMALLLSMGLALLGLAVSAAATADIHVLATRVVAGVGLGGQVPAAVVLVYELAPLGRRASAVALLHAFAAVGSVIGLALAVFVAPMIGWRALYLALSGLVLLVAVVRVGLPESPPWLAARERVDESLEVATRHYQASANGIQSSDELQAVVIDEDSLNATDSPSSSYTKFEAPKIKKSSSVAPLLALLLLWLVVDVCAFALGSYLPTLISFVGFNVYGSWCSSLLLYAAPFVGSVLASLLLDRRQWRPPVRCFASIDRLKSTLVLFAVAAAVFAVSLSYLPWTWTIVTTGASLVSIALAGVWSVVFAYTAEHFCVEKRARGVGFATTFSGVGGVLGAMVLFPRVYDVWMASVPGVAWTFGGALAAVAVVAVQVVGPRRAMHE